VYLGIPPTQYICQRMTHSTRPGHRRSRAVRATVTAGIVTVLLACGASDKDAPPAEFLVAAGDSTYWVRAEGSRIKLRGSPMVLARLDGHFRELYVVDDDRSYEDAVFVGQRLFQRDLVTGDSTEIFRDTLVMKLAAAYARKHPDARPLEPDEDAAEEPSISATADMSVLGVHGPYLSIEYHADTSGTDNETWHMTRHIVIDLRTGRQVSLAEIVGDTDATSVIRRGRRLYQETADSVRRDTRESAQRAARSLGRFRFDPRSFSLTAPNGTLMIAFSAPGQGTGGEGFSMPIRPIPVAEPAWWSEARQALPTSTREREEHWSQGAYTVKAIYDTSANPVRLTIVDSAGREFAVGGVTAPVHRIYWLDRPPIDKTQRTALTKAFDEAALYDEGARAVARARAITLYIASR
jgi:hypothetical protein